jgi:hypothetical protein
MIPSGWGTIRASSMGSAAVVNTAGGERPALLQVIATFSSMWPSRAVRAAVFNTIGKIEPVSAEKGEFHEQAMVIDKAAGLSIINFKAKLIDIEVDETPCEGLKSDAKDTCLEQQREKAIVVAEEKHHVTGDKKLAVMAPYFRSMNTDLMTPLSLAIASAIFVEYWGISTLGLRGYGSKFVNTKKLRQGTC